MSDSNEIEDYQNQPEFKQPKMTKDGFYLRDSSDDEITEE